MPQTSLYAGTSPDGETRTRTGDTTIFSRVLYQLSYLAAVAEDTAAAAAYGHRRASAPGPRT
jgi:hypothetical protein